MAPGSLCTAAPISSIASFISPGHCVPKVDAKFMDSKLVGHDGALSQEENASTDSGDDDFSSVHSTSASFTSKESEIGDDEKSLSPRSTVGDAATCVYSVMLLLHAQAACCGRVSSSGQKSFLGYHTEPVPDEALLPWQLRQSAPTAAPKSRKASKKKAKQASTAGNAAPQFGKLPKTALAASSEESWVATQRTRVTTVDDDAKVLRATRSILNKLTIEKFESLLDQLVACGIANQDHISMLIGEIFEKATSQHKFIPMYAELCVRLEKDPHITSCSHEFRRVLLNQCQNAFEQLLEPCSTEVDVDDEVKMRHKQQALGNIKLIGELLVQGMLSSSLFVDLAQELLQSRTECPEALECLAALVMVAGPKFDTADWQHHSSLVAIFLHMDVLTRDKSAAPRVRFLLRDVLDVRGAGWCTSANQAALKTAPMKLDEVREKATREQGATPTKHQGTWQKPAAPSKDNQGRGLLRLLETCRAPKVATKTSCRRLPGKSHLAGCDSQRQAEKKAEPKAVQAVATLIPPAPEAFDLVGFRRTLVATLTKLQADKDVSAAVQCIRLQEVPIEFQADQFIDVLSRIVEEKRGAVRRSMFAFASGLMANEQSPFDQAACFNGLCRFFQDEYTQLCSEVQRLPAILKSEFLPTMYTLFPTSELNQILPEHLHKC